MNSQWAVGATALFYWAIGILPFKDGFYSSTNPQVGGQTVGPEKNPGNQLSSCLDTAMYQSLGHPCFMQTERHSWLLCHALWLGPWTA